MPTVSIIIPSRNELFLQPTIDDILLNARGQIEVIVVLDGYWPQPALTTDPRVIILHNGRKLGVRNAINAGVAICKGDYVMKSDAHCMFGPGFDLTLLADCDDNWVVTPRRLRLDAENWCVQESSKDKLPIDYMYLSAPGHSSKNGNTWSERILQRLNKPEYLIDETMTMQSSSWVMKKTHFNNFLGGLSEVGYGPYIREGEEICLKTWLGGGRVMTNKKTWYAHLHKGEKYGRMYFLNKILMDKGIAYCNDFWFNNRWVDAKHDLAWLIERFMPVPSWTPELIEQVRKK